MNPSSAMRRPILFRLYYGLVLAAAAALVALAWGSRPEPPWPIVCSGLALLVLAEAAPVRLPGGGQMTAGTMVDVPLLLVVGPFWTAAADVAATLVVQGLFRRRPLVRVAHNASIYVIGAFAAAGAYTRLGGRIGEVEFPEGALALAACGVAFFLVNSTCVSVAIGLTEGPSAWRVWQRNFQSGILHHLAFVALGTLAAVVWRATGA
ncbi:MAG TPA: hypothetical protein VNM39_18285, partial [Verrucomicrobiae bacterium]|nr:hypothetical protein [Verrucomicrobiae bacterium]